MNAILVAKDIFKSKSGKIPKLYIEEGKINTEKHKQEGGLFCVDCGDCHFDSHEHDDWIHCAECKV
jgi:hypothetical protein